MQKNKIKKILLSGIFILSLFFIIPGIADAQSACSDKLSGLNRYSSCQVLTGDVLVVNAEACINACFKITNTTGKSVFIPTNTCAEWDAFLAHMPSGIATSSCITDPTISVSNTTKTYGDASFTITHSTNSAGAKTFSSSNTSVATITNAGLVTIVGGGTTTITFNTAATENHYAGTATATVTVNKANQTAPAAPTMASRTSTSITLNACSGGGCEYRRGSGSWQTSTTFSGLTAGTSYSFTQKKVETTNYNESSVSSAASFSTSSKATPTCTCSPTTKTYGDGTYTIGFTTNSTGTKSYSSGTTSVATINSSTGLITIGNAGTSTITCTVAADANYNARSCTGTQTVNKANQTAPAAPTCSSTTTNSVTISSCSGCEYRIATTINNPTTSNVFTAGINPGTRYTFSRRYASTTNYNASSWSSDRACITPINPPTNVSASAASNTSISTSWTAASGANSYHIYSCSGSSSCNPTTYVGQSASTSWTNTSLTPGTTYRYAVYSIGANQNSGASSIASATTTISPPTNVSASALSASAIRLTYTAAPGASSYHFYGCAGASCSNFSLIGSSSSTSWDHTGLSGSTTYRYRVYSIGANQNSGASSIASATTSAPPWACGNNFVDSRNGQSYRTMMFGSQCWMRDNLNYATGSSWCHSNNMTNCTTYGRLYDWSTAISACPSGWHLPSEAEFTALESTIGATRTAWISTSGWHGLYGGYRAATGNFITLGTLGYWWSSTPSSSYAWYRNLYSGDANVLRATSHPGYGFSARCLRN